MWLVLLHLCLAWLLRLFRLWLRLRLVWHRQHPAIVAKLAAKLKSYRYYTNASMNAEELAGYDCAALPSDPNVPSPR